MPPNNISQTEMTEKSQDEILAAILQKLGGANSTPPVSSSSTDSVQTASNTGGSTDILSSLLSNPDLIAKLPTIIASIKPILELLGKSSPTPIENIPVTALPIKSEVSTAAHTEKVERTDADSRTALLCAMKPYLGTDRQNAINYIVKLGKLGEILKTL